MKQVKVLFVCMGNICRSPTAEGVFSHAVSKASLDDVIKIDSAGTIAYHVGNPPDTRATAAAKLRGINLSNQRSRIVEQSDFEEFDYIIAMDYENVSELNSRCPDEFKNKIQLFLEYANNFSEEEVPDPYYGGDNGFENVLNLIEDATEGFFQHLKNEKAI